VTGVEMLTEKHFYSLANGKSKLWRNGKMHSKMQQQQQQQQTTTTTTTATTSEKKTLKIF